MLPLILDPTLTLYLHCAQYYTVWTTGVSWVQYCEWQLKV